MPRVRRFGSAKAKTDLRKRDRQAGEHGVGKLGRETPLFHELASGELGQERRRQRAVPPRLCLGRQRAKADVRSRFYRAEAGSAASHALWLDQTRSRPHYHCEQVIGQKPECKPRITRMALIPDKS